MMKLKATPTIDPFPNFANTINIVNQFAKDISNKLALENDDIILKNLKEKGLDNIIEDGKLLPNHKIFIVNYRGWKYYLVKTPSHDIIFIVAISDLKTEFNYGKTYLDPLKSTCSYTWQNTDCPEFIINHLKNNS